MTFIYTHLRGLESDAISQVAYNEYDNSLFVKFRDGSGYVYDDVDKEVFDGFPNGHGARQYWHDNVSGDGYSLGHFPTLEAAEPEPEQDPEPVVVKPKLQALMNEPPVFTLSNDGAFFAGNLGANTLTVNVKAAGQERYGVKYTVEHDGTIGGPFEPEFIAADEDDAIAQLSDGLSTLETLLGWTDINVKIVSVTHYLD